MTVLAGDLGHAFFMGFPGVSCGRAILATPPKMVSGPGGRAFSSSWSRQNCKLGVTVSVEESVHYCWGFLEHAVAAFLAVSSQRGGRSRWAFLL